MPQVLIKWQSRPREEATWEDFLTIKEQFPDFQLEDKLTLLGGGNDRDMGIEEMGQQEVGPKERPWRVYVRRKKEGKSGDQVGKEKGI